jgi:hypothetical protein
MVATSPTGSKSGLGRSHLRDAKMTQLVSLPTKSVRKYPSASNLLYVRGLLKVGESLKTNQAQESKPTL